MYYNVVLLHFSHSSQCIKKPLSEFQLLSASPRGTKLDQVSLIIGIIMYAYTEPIAANFEFINDSMYVCTYVHPFEF